jgi:hypothetical protein
LRSPFISSTSPTSGLLHLKLSFVLNDSSSPTISIALISFLNFLINFLVNFLRLLNSDYMTILEILYGSDRDDVEISYVGITRSSFLLKRGERNLFLLSNVLLSGLLLLSLDTLDKLVILKFDDDLITKGRRD